jgi:hypothetical protein
MKIVRCALFIVMMSAMLASSAAAEICVGVDVHFPPHAATPLLVRTLHDEVSRIWRPYGVRVDWDSTEGCPGPVGSFDVYFERPRVADRVRTGVVLGHTNLQEFLDRAPIHVDALATEEALRSLTNDRLLALAGFHVLGSTELGRALGRVLAHEMGHVLLAAPYHQARGLMRPTFFPADLAALDTASFSLSPVEVARLRNRERVLAAHARRH